MRIPMLATALTFAFMGAALAQGGPIAANGDPNNNVSQKVRDQLQNAGFSDVQVAPHSFLVHAKDKNGNPVAMIIGPDSFTMVTAIPASTTTGSGNDNTGSSSNSSGSSSGSSSSSDSK